MHMAQNWLQVPVPNTQQPVPKKEALETSDVCRAAAAAAPAAAAQSKSQSFPICVHLIHRTHYKLCTSKKNGASTEEAVDAHRCWRRGKMVQGTMLAWGGSSCQLRKRKIPMLAKIKEITMLAWGGKLLPAKKKKRMHQRVQSIVYVAFCTFYKV